MFQIVKEHFKNGKAQWVVEQYAPFQGWQRLQVFDSFGNAKLYYKVLDDSIVVDREVVVDGRAES